MKIAAINSYSSLNRPQVPRQVAFCGSPISDAANAAKSEDNWVVNLIKSAKQGVDNFIAEHKLAGIITGIITAALAVGATAMAVKEIRDIATNSNPDR